MPSKSKLYYYWDSCVFISYLNDNLDRVPSIQAIWEDAQNHRNTEIITSALSIAEVVMSNEEKDSGTLDPNVDIQIQDFWYSWGVKIVDINPVILHEARDLMRRAVAAGITGLKPPDAIHLATASWVDKNLGLLKEVHTYDDKWSGKYHTLLDGLSICEPSEPKPTIDTD
ncbi:MAG: PIN domain-containing protein [Ardenticatenaceae bacterium]|nr:PIN domain-containing protein [Anaerolineales bacterium]MCB8922995.1 PIN domain-containing protein [Ardenticatenaceae bacterium]MCB8990272.1 PIN domain-containing protein [Ardenticatenaceae bacterium]